MAFSDEIRQEAKRRSYFCCCVCRQPFVEAHHIIPQSEDGPDTLDNAAALCGACHTLFGANPDLRKQLRLLRNALWERYEKTPWPLLLERNRRLDELVAVFLQGPSPTAQGRLMADIRTVLSKFHEETAHQVAGTMAPRDLQAASGVALPAAVLENLPATVPCPSCGQPGQFQRVLIGSPYANVTYFCQQHGQFQCGRVDGLDD